MVKQGHRWVLVKFPTCGSRKFCQEISMFAMVGDYYDYFRKFYYFNFKILILLVHPPPPLDPRMFKICPKRKNYKLQFQAQLGEMSVLHTIQYQTGFVKITMYKHCTKLYQSSCKQRSDCKLLMTNLNYLSDRQGTIHCIYL